MFAISNRDRELLLDKVPAIAAAARSVGPSRQVMNDIRIINLLITKLKKSKPL